MNNIPSLNKALLTLFSLRDKWDFYTTMSGNTTLGANAELKAELDTAAQIWLIDVYCCVHDYFRRTLITARKTPKKTSDSINRDTTAQEVMARLSKIEKVIEKEESSVWHLRLDDVKQSIATAKSYFSDTRLFLEKLSQDEGELLLRRLSMMIIEEELPINLAA